MRTVADVLGGEGGAASAAVGLLLEDKVQRGVIAAVDPRRALPVRCRCGGARAVAVRPVVLSAAEVAEIRVVATK